MQRSPKYYNYGSAIYRTGNGYDDDLVIAMCLDEETAVDLCRVLNEDYKKGKENGK